jgi:superfamily II DNA or RNA helicase
MMTPKDSIQSKAVQLSRKNRFICLEWSTGTGKTLAAVKIVNDILKSNPKAKGYLICKESTHKKNWLLDIKKHKMSKVEKSMKTILYASLKNQNDKADFVVLDECHALTPLRIKHLRQVLQKGTKLIFLSATIPKEKKELINRLCKKVHYYTISLDKAFELKLLPEPSLVVHKIYLNDKIVRGKLWEYKARMPKDKKTGKFKKCSHKDLFMTLKNTPKVWGIICQGTEQETYTALTKQMVYYQELSEDLKIPYPVRVGCRNKFLNIASTRKKFIAEVKTHPVKDLVKQFRLDNARFICFTGSIKQVKELGSDSAGHSKNDDKLNQQLIDCFNNEECTELFAVKMLREGVNLTNIERGIITQLDSGIGSFFQMLGRCLRHEFPEMHLLVVQNTQDEVYFRKSMENFNKKYITYHG